MIHALDMEIRNTAPVLLNLIDTIKKTNGPNDICLNYERDEEMPNTETAQLPENCFGITKLVLPDFLKKLGIKTLTLYNGSDLPSLAKYDFIIFAENVDGNLWDNIKNDQLIADLILLFQKCRSITFDEWAYVAKASSLWQGLLSDVLKRLKNPGLEFIFYLGDPGKVLFFQVDELLNITNKFTSLGTVTFVLDEHEAINLWMMLNGELPNTTFSVNTAPGLKKKCFSIFRIMNIGRLLIYSVNNVILFSEDEQFIFARRELDQLAEIAAGARDKFISGFSFGLLRRLDIEHCIALGLAAFGAHTEVRNNPGPADLLLYIDNWIADQQQNDDTLLYQ